MIEVAITIPKLSSHSSGQLRVQVERDWGQAGIEQRYAAVIVEQYLVAGGTSQGPPLLLAGSISSARVG
jgi:hypothetical protein